MALILNTIFLIYRQTLLLPIYTLPVQTDKPRAPRPQIPPVQRALLKSGSGWNSVSIASVGKGVIHTLVRSFTATIRE
jgi:hypothetical protein